MSALPAPIDRKVFEAPRRDFDAMLNGDDSQPGLRALMASPKPPTLTQINLAKEFDDKAKAFLDKKNPDSPEAKIGPHREKAYATWKGLVAWLNDEEKTPKQVRTLYAQLMGRYERARLAKIAEQKRLDEAKQIEEQKRQRAAEAEHLLEVAAVTNDESALAAAIEVESAPLAPVISSVDTSAGKVEGSSATFRKTGRIVDVRAFLRWLADYASLVDLVELKLLDDTPGPALKINQSALDDKLNRGLIIPGVEIKEKPIVRNLSRA